MISTLVLANNCTVSHNYNFFFEVRTSKIQSLSNFKVYNTVLLTIIILCIRSPQCINLLTLHLYSQDIFPVTSTPSPWGFLVEWLPFYFCLYQYRYFQSPHVSDIIQCLSFTQHNALKVHLCYCRQQDFFSFSLKLFSYYSNQFNKLFLDFYQSRVSAFYYAEYLISFFLKLSYIFEEINDQNICKPMNSSLPVPNLLK